MNPLALVNIGWHYFILFYCFDVVVLAVTWFLFPETKGHLLEEIADVLDEPSSMTSSAALGKHDEGIADYAGCAYGNGRNSYWSLSLGLFIYIRMLRWIKNRLSRD